YEITPWRRVLTVADPKAMVMVAHLVNKNIDDLPASLSKRTIDMLRAMGFDGVVVSDDMDMGAITNEYGRTAAIKMAIDAGNDILVFGNNLSFDPNRGAQVHAAIVNMVKSGQISRARIRDSYRRIMRLKAYVR
ncbi:MAG: glycoside hydrolase family 3, partial [Alphaproteobacteria bacterium]|nr:glycoside hydrolase family 3 [Alphaproteobacteria bacterium]